MRRVQFSGTEIKMKSRPEDQQEEKNLSSIKFYRSIGLENEK